MKKNENKRVQRTKNSLKKALLSLLKIKTFDDITITDIIKEADYNRGTFYIHYEKKKDLLDDLMKKY
ncbi:TetR family transcriptional regulator [Niallia oryzisoli]|uniref:TetR family transcriptional regulator n=1 Tax=Niallia oryzisoli TaxID=1737571 RepID=A0ABZ2CAQ5_9BACI